MKTEYIGDEEPEPIDYICECGHDWNFHNILDNNACHDMDCKCIKFNPSNKLKKRGD